MCPKSNEVLSQDTNKGKVLRTQSRPHEDRGRPVMLSQTKFREPQQAGRGKDSSLQTSDVESFAAFLISNFQPPEQRIDFYASCFRFVLIHGISSRKQIHYLYRINVNINYAPICEKSAE